LVRSSLVFGGLWTALLVFREVSMPLMLAGPENQVLSVRIWAKWESGDLNQASALGVVMVFVMSVVILVAQRVTGQRIAQAQQQTRI
jgi:iron(III) transport system permease protein